MTKEELGLMVELDKCGASDYEGMKELRKKFFDFGKKHNIENLKTHFEDIIEDKYSTIKAKNEKSI